MTDLEMTKLCADAMEIGYKIIGDLYGDGDLLIAASPQGDDLFDPLRDDAQAMALVKRFHLAVQPPQFSRPPRWHVWIDVRGVGKSLHIGVADVLDLNRAIVECVAKMQASKA